MMADMHIPEKEQKKLVEEFERFEKEEIGEGKHEEFHNLVHKLEKKYL
jgi:hemerythrin-like domain-containing protein